MRKKGIRAVLFICLTIFLIQGLNHILCMKSPHGVDQARCLYMQPKNKVDVLFLGSSHVHCNVSTPVLWEEHGMAAYLLTGAEQPIWNSYHYLVEALKTQAPQLVVLDMFGPARFYDDYQEKWLDQNLDGMRISRNKYEAVSASTEKDRVNFFLGFTKYHSRYAQLQASDFQNFIWNRGDNARWKGYTPLITRAELTEPDMSHVTQVNEMTEKSQYYFDKIAALTKEKGIDLMLLCAPYLLEEEDQKVYNYIAQQAEKNGILFMNYNTTKLYREMGMDFSEDFADHAHLNEMGSSKYTEHLGKWITDHYDIPDRRGEKGYESWDSQIYYEEESAP